MNAPEPGHILAIETSGRVGSVALGRGDLLFETVEFSAARRHAVELLPTVERICARHNILPRQVEEVFVSSGPGSFTGLRIGITFAKTVGLEGRAGVVGVPTLDVIAQNACSVAVPPPCVAVLLDAKRHRVFSARFELDGTGQPAYRRVTEPAELDPAEFLAQMPADGAVLGEGIAYHREVVEQSGVTILPDDLNQPRAEVVFRLGRERTTAGRYDDPATLTPFYIRRPEAEEVYERRHGKEA